MNKPHVHKDVIIAYAHGAWVEWKNAEDEWEIIENPVFFEDEEYRIKPEREYPTTSLSAEQLRASFDLEIDSPEVAIIKTANAAIKQYIIDAERAK